jgi:hypothetical protein
LSSAMRATLCPSIIQPRYGSAAAPPWKRSSWLAIIPVSNVMPPPSSSEPTAAGCAPYVGCSSLKRTYPSGPFLAAIEQALQFGLGRVEKIILKQVIGDFFTLDAEAREDA